MCKHYYHLINISADMLYPKMLIFHKIDKYEILLFLAHKFVFYDAIFR